MTRRQLNKAASIHAAILLYNSLDHGGVSCRLSETEEEYLRDRIKTIAVNMANRQKVDVFFGDLDTIIEYCKDYF